MDDYLDSNTWSLINYTVIVKEDMYTGDKWSQVHNRYRLLRNPTYQIFYLIIPTAFLSVLGVFAFLIPNGADQLNLSVTTLLAVTVFMLVIADSMPRSSTSIPILSVSLINRYCDLRVYVRKYKVIVSFDSFGLSSERIQEYSNPFATCINYLQC